MAELSRTSVFEQIKKAKESLQNVENIEELRSALFSFMDSISRTILTSQRTGAVKGWARKVKDDNGLPLWTPAQSDTIEEAFRMVGGAEPNMKYQTTPIVNSNTPYDPASFSLDETYYGVKAYLDELDERNKILASQIGPVAMIKNKKEDYQFGPFPPYLPAAIPISPRIVLPAINTFLEAMRLMTTFGPLESGFLRTLFSIATAIFEVSRGEWKNGALSFLGVFGSVFVLMGSTGKVFRLVYSFINPDIQDKLEDDIYEGSKSLFSGFWLWLFSLTAPAFLREKMMALHNDLVKQVENYNEKIASLESATDAQAAPLGLKVSFKKIDPGLIPSFDDIQNIQLLLRLPQIQCLDNVQEMIKPLMAEPITRLVFELTGFITDKKLLATKCAGIPRIFGQAVKNSMKPTVTRRIGGAKKRKTRKQRRKN